MTARRVVAIDLGASSGRVALARWDGERGVLEEVHRFENAPVERDGHLHWDVERLWLEIERGLRMAADRADGAIDSVGIDGWAVDYALLDGAGGVTAPVFCYRDRRNGPAMRRALAGLRRERLFAITGVQFLPINTLYQLRAHVEERPREWERARLWVNLPEYFLYRLSGVAIAEYTNATHTQMLDAASLRWSAEIADALGLDLAKFPTVVPPGTDLGPIRGDLASVPQLGRTRVIAPACHDTGSAVAGLPFAHDALAFISSGTWSLVGTVLGAPVLTERALHAGFTNEGGVGGTVRFLTNVIGLWVLQQVVEELRGRGAVVTEASLADAAGRLPPDGPWFEADTDTFLAPGGMMARINDALVRSGYPAQTEPAEMTAAILRSLARRYADAIGRAGEVCGKRFDAVCIAGGGVKNRVLTSWTRTFTGLPVLEGPVESAALGNAAVQLAALEGSRALGDIQTMARNLDSAVAR
jgi:rhamnulokinase